MRFVDAAENEAEDGIVLNELRYINSKQTKPQRISGAQLRSNNASRL